MTNNQVSVSDLTRKISGLLSAGIGTVTVVGEISNFINHSSGHRYFSLKDDGAQINAVMWRSQPLTFAPKNGMKVIATGTVSVYAPRGQYQLDCRTLRPLGIGDLYLAYEELKARLSEKGYFDAAHKHRIPQLALKIGVITSPTGAAVRDIKTTLERRLPIAEVFFRPTLVQGDGAAADIVAAIRQLDSLGLDLIICGRGGGSIEDLWAFNMENVADAIYICNTPIISAVGHETDFTIADFVADLRAATPTAGAELASRNTQADLVNYVNSSVREMTASLHRQNENRRHKIEYWLKSCATKYLTQRINNSYQRIDEAILSMTKSMQYRNATLLAKVEHNRELLETLHPMRPLEKGFAVLKSNGKFINKTDTIKGLTEIEIIRTKETAIASITEVKEN